MRKRSITSIITLFCLTIVPVTTVNAQSVDRFQIEIPFEFVLAGRTLPAGKYQVQRLDGTRPNVLMFKNTSNGRLRVVVTHRVENENPSVDASLVFQRRSGKYYLFQVWTVGSMNGNQIPFATDRDRSTRQSNDLTFVRVRASTR